VLKQGQLGISGSMASKIPVKFKRARIDSSNKATMMSIRDTEEEGSLLDMLNM